MHQAGVNIDKQSSTSVIVVKSFSTSSSLVLFSRFRFAFSRFVLCRHSSTERYTPP